MRRARRLRRMRGLSLAELMVGLVLGLLITLAGGALLVLSSTGYLAQSEAARLDDGGRYALDIIGRAVRQAAFVNLDGADAPATAGPEDSASIGGLDDHSVSRAGAGIGAPLAPAVNGSDVLAVRYFGSGVGADGDGSVLNCAGFGVAAAASEAGRGWSIFYVGTDASGEAELRCKYRGAASWGADAIVRGVDSFQVLYGLDTDEPPDGVANLYLSAGAIEALDDALPPGGADAAARARERNRRTRWKRVVSIKLALLLHGERGSGAGGAPQRFDLFGAEYADLFGARDRGVRIDEAALPADQRGRARHLVGATIMLRNSAAVQAEP